MLNENVKDHGKKTKNNAEDPQNREINSNSLEISCTTAPPAPPAPPALKLFSNLPNKRSLNNVGNNNPFKPKDENVLFTESGTVESEDWEISEQIKNYLGEGGFSTISKAIKEVLKKEDIKPLNPIGVTMKGIIEEMKKADEKYRQYEYNDEDITDNPIAWTNPDNGKIYIGINSPEYSHLNNRGESELNLAKIISTIIHEGLHASSHQHKGLQPQTNKEEGNLDYDEYVTDYFAREVYNKILPGKDYVTNYFTKGLGGKNKMWGGNIVEFMIQSKHSSLEEIRQAYAEGKPFNELDGKLLEDWKTYAKLGKIPDLPNQN
ncbi:hypothetical protein BDD26_3187 [Xenorhabdus cabanillasii]|uniref:Uncharacterized protein n=1 Tax=Xenorhabdus cabanillasii TaxID=351673 RepID=A0A3D9UFR3_9GAMM|nr:hypothetical protein [Xenorhabdus cabanillasii]REF28302.1 hypothetical protein BDD26_3187 [Xenorhabdus cabanillasii]